MINGMSIEELKKSIRQGKYQNHTSGIETNHAQFNVAIMHREYADDFNLFCKKNIKPCPVVYQSEPGERLLKALGDVDICLDVPKYRVFKDGQFMEEKSDIVDLWDENLVTFVIGCSFTFDKAICDNGISLLHVEKKMNVAMYDTNIELTPVGKFKGNMVVSMRWIDIDKIDKVIEVTEQYPHFHGTPININNPLEIGIKDLSKPDYGEFIDYQGDKKVPVFWGCGVTPQNVIKQAKLPLFISHKPGCMLIGDVSNDDVLNNQLL